MLVSENQQFSRPVNKRITLVLHGTCIWTLEYFFRPIVIVRNINYKQMSMAR